MKLNKLQTLRQFIDLMVNEERESNTAWRFDQVEKNNEFQKKKPELEMFINPIEYPIDMYYRPDEGVQKYPQECYLSDKKKWEEAENKRIFKGWSKSVFNKYVIVNGRYELDFSNADCWRLYPGAKVINSLYDLAEATKGELQIDIEL